MSTPVEIVIKTIDQNTVKTAKGIQAEMDAMRKSLKEAGVSQQAYNQALKASSAANQKQKFSFTELSSAIGLASQALMKMKQGYDFAKQGAQIEFAATKFDRLAKTIGTTGDALKDKLLVATKGTMSEMQAMASATDLISLGLVKTEEDTIRLSSVVSGLGMDMNQLVLALSNQTTMRFDQLGVAVVGFDEKVKALEKTGMSAQDAFTEAFLRQAEEQLLKVGNAADTTAGQFARFEAQLADIKNEAAMATAELAGPLIGAMAENMKANREWRDVLKEISLELYNQYKWTQTITPEMLDLVEAVETASKAVEIGANRWDEMNAALEVANAQLPLTEEQIKAISDANALFLGVLGDVKTAQDDYYGGLAEANKLLDDGKIKADEHAEKVAELAKSYQEASADIVLAVVEMKLATDGWTNAELNAYLNIGMAQGKFTQDQVNMANGAIEQADRLIASFGDMGDQAEHVGERAKDAAEGFGVMADGAVGLEDAVRPATAAVGGLKSQINSLPPSGSSWSYDFQINVHGQVPRFATATYSTAAGYNTDVHAGEGSGRDSGGPGEKGGMYMIGAGAQPEAFIAPSDGQFIPNIDQILKGRDDAAVIAAIERNRIDERRLARSIVTAMQQAGY